MKKLVFSIACLFLVLLCSTLSGCSAISRKGESQTAQKIANSPSEIVSKEIEFTIPEPERWELSNGLTVVYYYDDELPQVRGKMYFPGGAFYNSFGIPGLAAATGSQMREGAIPGFTPAQFDKHLDDLAASIESSFGQEYGSVGFSCLAEDFNEIFSLFSRVVKEPSFDSERLRLWQKLAVNSIQQRRDDPDTMASTAFTALVYGQESVYAQQASFDSVRNITPAKMREYHRLFVRPDGAYLAISGAIPKEVLQKQIEEKFGVWPRGDKARPQLPAVTAKPRPGIYVLERDFDQSTILMGHLGPSRTTPDLYALNIFNEVFGFGGFGSILFQEIRSKLGLAYTVYGGVSPGKPAGVFQLYLQTKNSEVGQAIFKAIELTQRAISVLPDQKMLDDAKSGEERSFVFKFANSGYIVDRWTTIRLLGFPADYDRYFLERVREVDGAQALGAAKKWIQPDDMIIVVVGRNSANELQKLFGDKLNVYPFTFDTEPHFVEVR